MRRVIDILGAIWSTCILFLIASLDRKVKVNGRVVARPGLKLKGRGNISIGAGTRIKGAIIESRELKSSITIGRNCYISDFCILNSYDGTIDIGNNVSINARCFISGDGGVVIGDNTRIASDVSIISNNHIFSDANMLIKDQGLSRVGIEIGEDVWIGCSVKILDGIKIGNGAIIGAGSVVTKSVLPGDVVVGVPGRKIKNRFDNA